MTEVLIPYSNKDFTDENIANSLHNLVYRNRKRLLRRGCYGFVHRYGGELALAKVQKGKQDHDAGVSSHFLIVQTVSQGATFRKEIIGTASIQKGQPLYKITDLGILTPTPAIAEKLGLRTPVDDARLTHNIGVIIDEDKSLRGGIKGHRDALAYKELVEKVSEDSAAHAWMLIPEGKRYQHERYYATEAQLGRIAVARFDDLESSRHVPHLSGLYLAA